jgi:ATP phosphoribosyltransferase regulatory subunit
MNDNTNKALLPPGMNDMLPPDAAFEADTIARLLSYFAHYGYERIKPPLIEFEDSLLAGNGADMSSQMFRLLDPASQRMAGLRPDMTLQTGRIAASRLKNTPRPLRLSYAGEVLRTKGSNQRPDRQFAQVGAEIIGSSAPEADAEAVLMATESLAEIGVRDLSVDLGLPTLVSAVLAPTDLDEATRQRLSLALERKDAAGLSALKGVLGDKITATLSSMIAIVGTLDATLNALNALDLSPDAARERGALNDVAGLIKASAPDLELTVDPVENRGFEYHKGVTFTLYAAKSRSELGNGGRYLAGGPNGKGEAATGFTLFMDSLLKILPSPSSARRLFLPKETPRAEGRKLRSEGWITIEGLEHVDDVTAEARRMGCSNVFNGGTVEDVEAG